MIIGSRFDITVLDCSSITIILLLAIFCHWNHYISSVALKTCSRTFVSCLLRLPYLGLLGSPLPFLYSAALKRDATTSLDAFNVGAA